MSATQVTVSGSLPTFGGPPPSVTFTLSEHIFNTTQHTQVPRVAHASAAIAGAATASFAITVPANDDALTTPANTDYNVNIVSGNVVLNDVWVVASSAQVSTSLLSLPIVLPSTNGCRLLTYGAYMITKTELNAATSPVILVDSTLGSFTVLLPNANEFRGRYTIKNIGTANSVTVKPRTSSRLIDGFSSTTVGPLTSGAPWLSLDLITDGTGWRSV